MFDVEKIVKKKKKGKDVGENVLSQKNEIGDGKIRLSRKNSLKSKRLRKHSKLEKYEKIGIREKL